MNKTNNKKFVITILIILITGIVFYFSNIYGKTYDDVIKTKITSNLNGTIIYNNDKNLIIKDENNVTYDFETDKVKENAGTEIKINCDGDILKDNTKQDCEINDYEVIEESKIPSSWLDNGIFSKYYVDAYETLKKMTTEEKIAQTLLVRFPDTNGVNLQQQYQFGGYVFFERDFKNKTVEEIQVMINEVQNVSKIPILTAIDEEGGKVTRLSSNPNVVTTPFKSSQELYANGGFEAIKEDVLNKSKVLKNLGLNLNLAPVLDISVNPNNYIYPRSFGQNANMTSEYAETVVKSSKNTGVSYTLKHFPGYGSNLDTHQGISLDNKSYESILNEDILPFKRGINAGAEAVMTSHNIHASIDQFPASLSPKVHDILRSDLNFTGVIITDDLSMKALDIFENKTAQALLAGNDLIITSDADKSFQEIQNGLNNGIIKSETLDKVVFRILAFKYSKGLLTSN